MKRFIFPLGSLIILGFLLVAVGCKNSTPTSMTPLDKSSTVIMKASAKTGIAATLGDIPVTGGTLSIQTAMISVAKYRIEENTGNDVEQQGQNNSGDQGGADNEKGGPDNELNNPDIVVTGPFAFDIASGEVAFDSVAVYPGTFKKVDLAFMINTTPPFNGKTIVISGSFTPTNGTAIPVILKSEFNQEIKCYIAGNGITVTANSTIPVVVTFDLAGWFSNVDFSNAQVANGEIVIDGSNNASLLAAFEANLAKYVDVEGE